MDKHIPTLSPQQMDEGLYAAGYSLLERDLVRQAAAVFRLLLARAPMQSRSWMALGYCHERCDDLDVAAWLYERGVELCEDRDPSLLQALHRVSRTQNRGARP
jgi:Flp pilus assembly protein TadD